VSLSDISLLQQIQIYNVNVVFITGSYDAARVAIDEVVQNAKTLDEKLNAYTHRVMCLTSETSDFSKATDIGIEILSKYGIDIPLSPSKAVMAKEEMKVKLALRKHSISSLTNFPSQKDPLLALCQQLNYCALCKLFCFFFDLVHAHVLTLVLFVFLQILESWT
jgi:hypothetical protein